MNSSITAQTGFAHLTDLPCITLQYGNATAVISLYGGQVLSYRPAPDVDKLWLSPLAQWHNQTPIRGGVPICWPWFGPADSRVNPKQNKVPNHGVVRTRMWQLVNQHTDDSHANATLEITVDDLPHHAGDVTLQLQVILDSRLTINLCCNTSLPQQAALHSYFAITELTQTRVQPLPRQYSDKVTATTVSDASEQAIFNAEVDRVYPSPAASLQLLMPDSVVTLNQHGQDATVVWNPWVERSQQITDLHDNSYLEFICVETARLQLDKAAPLNLTQQIKAAT
ncbi:D-hexose-6-phosphate mutarotase [Rheinheimera aquimaris]|uniref:aldose epimerase family protein n=1 Tax=Rheinheimera aquimaris TaxID=412437 RepID=UPI000E9F9082|nr:D-hexose-6-phosphate mutarotase [Rheinheimera aquimaris]HBN88262.1 D-hexose-6-phosphate mutarotase [Rheinheimera sp.]